MAYGKQVTEWIETWRSSNGDAIVPAGFLTDLFGEETPDSTLGELPDDRIAELLIYDLSMNQMRLDAMISELYAKTVTLEQALINQQKQQMNRAARRAGNKNK